MGKNILKVAAASLLMLGLSVGASAKSETVRLFVNGKCATCEARIEKTVNAVKGVKACGWDMVKKQLVVKFDPAKTSELDIEKAVARVGHDTKDVKATDEAYNALPECCKYDRNATAKKSKK